MLEYKPFDFKASVQDEGKGIIHAVVSVFGNVDSYGDVMVKGAFKNSIERGKKKGKLPPGVWSHDWERPIAKTLDAWETDEGLNVLGQFNLETKDGQDAYSNVKHQLFDEYSFGFKRVKGGEEEKEGKNYVSDVEWLEWSPVLVGANRETYTAAVKSALAAKFAFGGEDRTAFLRSIINETRTLATTEREFEELLRELGYSRSQSVSITNHGFKSILRDAASDDADPAAPNDTSDADPHSDGAADASSDAVDTPSTETDDAQADSETLDEGGKSEDGEAIVTGSETPAPDEPPTDGPLQPKNAVQLEETKDKLARAIAQRQALLDANIELALSRFAGS